MISAFLAVFVAVGCTPEEVCPGGSLQVGDQCTLLGSDGSPSGLLTDTDGLLAGLEDSTETTEIELRDASGTDDSVRSGDVDQNTDDVVELSDTNRSPGDVESGASDAENRNDTR